MGSRLSHRDEQRAADWRDHANGKEQSREAKKHKLEGTMPRHFNRDCQAAPDTGVGASHADSASHHTMPDGRR
jgi:hypothetical protein